MLVSRVCPVCPCPRWWWHAFGQLQDPTAALKVGAAALCPPLVLLTYNLNGKHFSNYNPDKSVRQLAKQHLFVRAATGRGQTSLKPKLHVTLPKTAKRTPLPLL